MSFELWMHGCAIELVRTDLITGYVVIAVMISSDVLASAFWRK